MTNRQLQYKKNRLTGMSCYAAARAAGYSQSYSLNAHNRIGGGFIDKEIQFEIEKAGATMRFVAERLVRFSKNEDSRAALPALKQICDLLNLKKETQIMIDQSKHLTLNKTENTIINVFNPKELAGRIRALNGKTTTEVTALLSGTLGVPAEKVASRADTE